MATGNDLYQDALIARALEIENLKDRISKKVVTLLNKTEEDLILKIRSGMGELGNPASGQRFLISERHKRLLEEIRTIRSDTWREANGIIRNELLSLSKEEAALVLTALPTAIGIELSLVLPTAAALSAIVTSRPFQGRVLREWARGLEATDLRRIQDAIQLGLVEGDSIDQIVTRVRGTRATGFAGPLQTSRRNAQAIVRTAVIHVSNAARESVFIANSDVILGLKWTAVLDGRTTPICMSRDGKVASIGGNILPPGFPKLVPNGARPPAHFGCRSIMIPIISPEGVVGNRPFVVDTRSRERREIDFRQIAREQAGDRWRTMSRSARATQVRNVRSQWAIDRVGTLPAETTYSQFLKRQSSEFQNEVLGTIRGKAFRKGISLDQLVTRTGRRISLSRLRLSHPEFFQAA